MRRGADVGSLPLVGAVLRVAIPVVAVGCYDRGPATGPDGDVLTMPLACTATGASTASCADPLPVFEGGERVDTVCPEQARARGLTIVDLSDDWVPRVLREAQGAPEPHPFRARYVALANERFGDGPAWERARADRFLELYGVLPSVGVLAKRLLDDERHACHAAVEGEPLASLNAPVQPFSAPRSVATRSALATLERRLICERVLPARVKRPERWRLQAAFEDYQRKQAIVSRGVLDAETRRVLAEDTRELDFRALLRGLRARVVDATGLIEDGTASSAPGSVLGRRIDSDAFYAVARYEPLAIGAPDLVSPATEAAARALGWTDPDRAAAFFRARDLGVTRDLVVALRLPPAPRYHGEHMALRAEIDRGDVWYERPPRRGRIERRPTLTLYAADGHGGEIALVRWPTTIGGWKEEVGPAGGRGLSYKNSDVGKRLWRDVISSPAWLPPKTTPPRAMVRRAWGPEKWLPDTDIVGPGYASAFGLVMLVHHKAVEGPRGIVWGDNGIRTHGTVGYQSVLRGESHGCHRLFNHSALQLASFLLRHRNHVAHGAIDKPFTRMFTWRGRRMQLPIPHRGYRFELTPPVEVEVLEGNVRGRVRRAPRGLVSRRRGPAPRSDERRADATRADEPGALLEALTSHFPAAE